MIWYFQKLLSHRLLAWSVLSIAAGLVLWFSVGEFWRGFSVQAMAWGGIDALIALLGLRGLTARLDAPVDENANAAKARGLRRILWINTGLDGLYVAGGLALIFSLGVENAFNRGMGWGVVVQGSFLLLFDLLHARAVPANEISLPTLPVFEQPEHLPYQMEGKEDAPLALLVHGFPGTPGELRPLAERLHSAGWSVSGLLVPGLGRELPGMFHQRAVGWANWLAGEIETARGAGRPVILIGFSLGGAISAVAARKIAPDRLVLLAPFAWEEPLLLRVLLGLLRLIFPLSFQPFRALPAFLARIQEEARRTSVDLSGVDIDQLRQVRIPLVFIEQFRRLSQLVYRGARGLTMPVLLLQGEQDEVVRPFWSRSLAVRIGKHVDYHELPGAHHTFMAGGAAFPQAADLIINFAIREKEDPKGFKNP
jgi:pimeloyl-ACP methyl ester carboxylesterase